MPRWSLPAQDTDLHTTTKLVAANPESDVILYLNSIYSGGGARAFALMSNESSKQYISRRSRINISNTHQKHSAETAEMLCRKLRKIENSKNEIAELQWT